jgi:hypothetical protein
LILAKAPRSAKVEVARVFIAKDAVLDFSPLVPIGGYITVFLAEVLLREEA